jgi:hypothetical protein
VALEMCLRSVVAVASFLWAHAAQISRQFII